MPDNRMYVVDVFAREIYAGNQLAVFLNASSLTADEMQRTTRETNFSEAAFAESGRIQRDEYAVRIFDPTEELPFAGYPTLGTAFVIREHLHEDRPDESSLDLGVGRIPVRVERDEAGNELLWVERRPPPPVAVSKRIERCGLESAMPVHATMNVTSIVALGRPS